MSADLAALTAAAVFLLAGFGLLSGIGMIDAGARSAIVLGGLAYIAGLVATMIVAIMLLCLGVSLGAVAFALSGVVIGGAGFATGIWRAGRWPRLGAPRLAVRKWIREHPVAIVAAVVLALVAIAGYRWAEGMPMVAWDSWSIWARKAVLLFDFGTLRPAFFTSSSYAFMHPDYPLLVPVLESVWFRLLGSANTQSLHVEFWIFYLASLWAAASIAARHTRAALWIPVIGFAAFAPAITGQLMTMYADIPMAALLMLGVLLLGLWLIDGQRSYLFLAVVFLAGCANTKNEGLTYGVCALAIAFLVAGVIPIAGRRRADLRDLALGTIGFAILIAPWRIWLAVHHIGGDMPIGKGLDPSYLSGRTSRIGPTLTSLYAQLTNTGAWSYLLPVVIAVVLACLVRGRLTRPAAFYGLTGIGVFVFVVWAYMINPSEIHWYLSTSATRTVDGLMFVGIAALLQLPGGLMLARESAESRTEPASHERRLHSRGAGAGVSST